MTDGDGPAPIRILLADDHAPLREALRTDLEDEGFDVCCEAVDGPAAVEGAVRERPDVCLLDLRMPGGGLEALRSIRSRLPGAKVVVLTVSRDADDVTAAEQAGAAGFLLKDLAPGAIAATLRAVVSAR